MILLLASQIKKRVLKFNSQSKDYRLGELIQINLIILKNNKFLIVFLSMLIMSLINLDFDRSRT